MKSKIKKLQITCDGGAATGKTTGAKMIAKYYNLKFMSSGLLYRYATYLLLKHKPINRVSFLRKKFSNLNYKKLKKLNLHTPQISENSAIIAKVLAIRKILKNYQLKFVNKYKNCVIEGRDSGTKVLPTSNVKFFFVCSPMIAAKRRFKELKRKNPKINFKSVKKALKSRNLADTTRKHSKLTMHKTSVVVDTGIYNSKQKMLNKMIKHVEKVLNS